MLGSSTEMISSTPVTMLSASLETSDSRSAFCSTASSSTPPSTPGSVPLPPKMETPPSSTAATTASSMPTPLSARALE